MNETCEIKPEIAISNGELFCVRLIAVVLIFLGANAISKMVVSLMFSDWATFDLWFLGIFLGKELVEQNNICRKIVMILAWLGIIRCLFGAICFTFFGETLPVDILGYDTGYSYPPHIILMGVLFLLVFFAGTAYLLHRPGVRAAFIALKTTTPCKNWWLPLTIVMLIYTGQDNAGDYYMRQQLQKLNHYTAKVKVIDAETGVPVNATLSYDWRKNDKNSPFLHISGTRCVSVSEWELDCVGLKNSQTVTFSANGYDDCIVMLVPKDNETRIETNVKLKKSKK